MSGQSEVGLCHALRRLGGELRARSPSAELDARFERSVQAWSIERARVAARRRLSPPLIAAGTIAVVVGFGGWAAHELGQSPPAMADSKPTFLPEPSTSYSGRDAAAVLHVRASLGARLPQRSSDGLLVARRHYWVDIGISGDGTLYVERVTPVDEGFVP